MLPLPGRLKKKSGEKSGTKYEKKIYEKKIMRQCAGVSYVLK
jgi:hypothetical protein